MQQHPVPQNVSSYQFRLVGDMTLKQFALLAFGIVFGFILYQLPLPASLKFPLIFLSALTGFALAFVPIEDRPLDRWLVAFLKSVYSPTQFSWRKSPQPPEYFKSKPPAPPAPASVSLKKDPRQLTDYLLTLPSPPPTPEVDRERQLLDKITQLFQSIRPASVNIHPLPQDLPEPKLPSVRVRHLTGLNFPLKGEIRVKDSPPVTLAKREPQPEPLVEFKPLLFGKKDLASLPAASPLPVGTTTAATTNPRLPFPAPPDSPNLIVGMVIDKYARILDNAIIEIRDQNHHPVRAVKTNKLGQFFTASPLPNGRYDIIPEKDGYDFATMTLDLTGQIVDPLEIRARNEGPTPTIR